MASWFPVWLRADEAFRLREVLSQTAAPNSFQSQLVQRLDAALEQSRRPRFGRQSPDTHPHLIRGGH